MKTMFCGKKIVQRIPLRSEADAAVYNSNRLIEIFLSRNHDPKLLCLAQRWCSLKVKLTGQQDMMEKNASMSFRS